MNEKKYFSYFQNNIKYGIKTFQDVEIESKIIKYTNSKSAK